MTKEERALIDAVKKVRKDAKYHRYGAMLVEHESWIEFQKAADALAAKEGKS